MSTELIDVDREKFSLAEMAQAAFQEAERIYAFQMARLSPDAGMMRRASTFVAISKTLDICGLNEKEFRVFCSSTLEARK